MVKTLKIRKPKNIMERITWSCLGAVMITFFVVILTITGLAWLAG